MKHHGAIALALLLVVAGCGPSGGAKDAPVSPASAAGSETPRTRTEAQGGKLRIGAFNMEILGATKLARPHTLAVLAAIAASYDVLAIEEVGSNSSSASEATCRGILDGFVSEVNELAGPEVYAYLSGDQYAILYRRAEFEPPASSLYEGSQSFSYRPLTAYFKTRDGGFDFSMLCIHTSPGKAASEIPALRTAMAEVAARYAEADVVCLGDFNADGSYYAEGGGPYLAGFPEGDYITAIPNGADTTVAASSNTYDRIELSSSLATDYDNSWGVIDFGELYDLSACEGTANSAGTEAGVSDHYPVWAEFSTGKDSD
jgi:hypothetical protein